jgi:hypothetical protein
MTEGYIVMARINGRKESFIFPTKRNAQGFFNAIKDSCDECIISQERVLISDDSNVRKVKK